MQDKSIKISGKKYIIVVLKIIMCLLICKHIINGYNISRYTQLTNIENIVNYIFICFLIFGLCTAVLNAEKYYTYFKNNNNKMSIFYAFYLSGYVSMFYNPLNEKFTEIQEYKRIIGQGINAGVDVSARISSFNRWFIFFAISFMLFYIFINYVLYNYTNEDNIIINSLNYIVIIADMYTVIKAVSYFSDISQDTVIFHYADYMIFLFVLCGLTYIIGRFEKHIEYAVYIQLIFSILMFAIPVTIALTGRWNGGRILMAVQVFGVIFVNVIILLLKSEDNNISAIPCSAIAIISSFIPFCTSLYIEMITILNRHNIFIRSVKRDYIIAVIFGVVAAAFIVIVFYKKNITYFIDRWKEYAYPAAIFGISCLWRQIPVSGIYNADIYESANASILISDFFNYGEIPIVQHYGGHMMTGVLEGIIYGILNNDISGAIFTPYAGYIAVIINIIFYYIIKNIWDEDSAVITILFLPFYNYFEYWGLGMLVVLALIYYVKKNTYLRAALLWTAIIWCVLYRLDLGYSFVLAAIAVMIIYIITERNTKALKQLGITLAAWAVAGVSGWFVICFVKNVNPVSRLVEFLLVSMSNQNWAYVGIGDKSLMVFGFAYMILPFIMIICLIYSVFNPEIRKNAGIYNWIIMLTAGFAYFTNFSRGLVRHSLAESAINMMIWSAYFFIALFISYMRNNRFYFLPAFLILILVNSLFVSDSSFAEICVSDSAAERVGFYTDEWVVDKSTEIEENDSMQKTYWEQIYDNKTVIDRVIWDNELFDTISSYRKLMDVLLDNSETFVDFVNKTFLYSALGRKNPVYISQSPMQLSGEYTQKCYVEEIENVPVVLMPYDKNNDYASEKLDGVPNGYRYYIVTEYIYQNYRPLCVYGDKYAVWCLNDRYEELKQKLKSAVEEDMDLSDVKMADYGYDGPYYNKENEGYGFLPAIHNYELGMLPFIWASADYKNSAENNVIAELRYENDMYIYDNILENAKKSGNYLKVHIDFDKNAASNNNGNDTGSAIIRIGEYEEGIFKQKYFYFFTIKEGSHDYIFRVSNDYYWFVENMNAVMMESRDNIYNIHMEILEGD